MKAFKILIILAVALLLCGCSTDRKKCIESHTELKPMFFPDGKGGMRMVMMPQTVCDKWEA